MASGCSLSRSDEPATRVLAPSDFAAAQPADYAVVTEAAAPAPVAAAVPKHPAPAPRPAPAGGSPGVRHTVDAMVGQVNGRPIYAGKVFDPIHDQLATRSRQVSRPAFRDEARKIIKDRLLTIVIETLILAEAEAALNDQQRQGLLGLLKDQRAELIRLHGQGSAKIADLRLREEDGSGLDERVDEIRAQAIIQSHMRKELAPKINVSRKDIIRYYRGHPDEFNPKPGRTIHMIRTDDDADADAVDKLLAAGKPFLEVASDATLNNRKPGAAGLFGEGLIGEGVLTPELNGPMLKLQAGEHTSRISLGQSHIWIYVKTISTGEARTLNQVQAEIRRKLTNGQYNELVRKYHARLFAEGSFDPKGPANDPLLPMVDALLEVGMTRYALPE